MSVPTITKNGVFLGIPFIKALIKKYKRSPTLCYGIEAKIKKVFNELGYSREDILHILNDYDDAESKSAVLKKYESDINVPSKKFGTSQVTESAGKPDFVHT